MMASDAVAGDYRYRFGRVMDGETVAGDRA